ncbi:hypothetical protein QBC46DRAFT_396257 [Diplogelasinospora grovesii]|uniref:ER-bound oxygenase mpaB/mpaB'/Rubber oxygenase catalytic domain-containing protein n=1 Tax=Diplogelasinospora grovesii TaxID=303347 RepID=A0AAN6RZT3_9PEZI|nr:hypothetical protein QBC46DRAFT_396257 [Diplogelasinospora grovesii]
MRCFGATSRSRIACIMNLSGFTLPEWLPWRAILPCVAIGYLALVRMLRFQALRKMEHKYAAYLSDPYRLDYKQARDVMQLSLLYDTPFLFAFGTQWALIKSYGIATGTPLLVKTRQLCDPQKIGKRAEDTAVFLMEFLVGDMDSERGRLAMAKLNWLHRQYAADIVRTDYVHTLALFVLEPQLWIGRYEWRALTELEKVAYLIYWREIAHRMGFGDMVPETLEELEKWKAEYERTHLYFIPENRIVTDASVELFLRGTPKFLHGFMRKLFVSFIDEKDVRLALGYPDPPAWATLLTTAFFRVRGFVIRHLFLPRLDKLEPLGKPGGNGRICRSSLNIAFEPWYVADSWYNRLVLWVKTGGKMGPSADRFKSDGYLPEELGPVGFEKIGKESVREEAQSLEEYVRRGGSAGVGCPFAFQT